MWMVTNTFSRRQILSKNCREVKCHYSPKIDCSVDPAWLFLLFITNIALRAFFFNQPVTKFIFNWSGNATADEPLGPKVNISAQGSSLKLHHTTIKLETRSQRENSSSVSLRFMLTSTAPFVRGTFMSLVWSLSQSLQSLAFLVRSSKKSHDTYRDRRKANDTLPRR